MRDLLEDVLVQDVRKLRGGKRCLGEPSGHLVVPHEGMSAHNLIVLASKLDQTVGGGVVEHAALWFDELPLHHVLGCHTRKLAREHRPIGRIRGEHARIDG